MSEGSSGGEFNSGESQEVNRERAKQLAIEISRMLDKQLLSAGNELGKKVDFEKREKLAKTIHELLGVEY